ncbi:LytR/AlgR family response regulator transcription factor [Clostridium aminobutyricum]|uniref:Stage 0 sporulation protein A homolog n=1 Tax=Clostridium aminobutyricum TaxID=33953 RepID=A0A939D6H6_CLOAM|nr:LytTR family DNA-binding domain-containing protein [Clostridium aminobutyricum]MBN7771982.1 response regulator transcription factor [Clostridium aminobutyricum]
MITILLSCSDLLNMEKIARNIIRSTGNAVCIFYATTASEALNIIKDTKQAIDLFFVDVNLKESGGYKLETEIRKINIYEETPIIFITKISYDLIGSSPLSSYQSYKKRNYISLPIDDLDVQGKLGLYLDNIISENSERENKDKPLVFKHSQGYIKVYIQKVAFIEVQNKCCKLYTAKGAFELKNTNLITLQSMIHIDSFVQCHRSYLLNVNHLSSIEKSSKKNWTAYFNELDQTCPISITYIKNVYNTYRK